MIWDAGLAAVGLVLFLFASTAQTALASLSRTRVHQLVDRGRADAKRLDLLLDNLARYHAAAQVLQVLATALTLASITVVARDSWQLVWPSVVTGAFLSAALMLALLALPRGVAGHDPELVMLALYYPIRATAFVLGPVVRVLNRVGGFLARMMGLRDIRESSALSSDESSRHSNGRDHHTPEEDEQEMIDSIIDLDKTTARELMVPRMDVVALPSTATVDEAVEVFGDRGYSRLPIYEESIDRVIGVLYAKDLFRVLRRGELTREVHELVRPAYFIPESKKTDELLRELQKQKVHIAIVADEYGGTAGVVTIEDLLEEIVGEIQDEYDREEEKIVEVSDDEAIFDATVSIDDVNDALNLELEGEDVDTIGGLLYEKLGKVPLLGDRVEMNEAVLRVESTAGRRIRKVRVTRQTTPSTPRAA